MGRYTIYEVFQGQRALCSNRTTETRGSKIPWPKPIPLLADDKNHQGPTTAIWRTDKTIGDGSKSYVGITPMALNSHQDKKYPAYTAVFFPSQAEMDSWKFASKESSDGKSRRTVLLLPKNSTYYKAKQLTGGEDWDTRIDLATCRVHYAAAVSFSTCCTVWLDGVSACSRI